MRDFGIYEGSIIDCHMTDGQPVFKVSVNINDSVQVFGDVIATTSFGGITAGSAFTALGDNAKDFGVDGAIWTEVEAKNTAERCLIQFINGNPHRPVIVGWLRHPSYKSGISKPSPGQSEIVWNGIKVGINAAGELAVTHSGTPKIVRGEASDESTSDTSSLTMRKNGSVEISNDKGIRLELNPETEYARLGIDGVGEIVVDTKEKTVHVRAKNEIRIIQGDMCGIQMKDGKLDIGNNVFGALEQIAVFLESLTKPPLVTVLGANAGGPVVPNPALAAAATVAAAALRSICG